MSISLTHNSYGKSNVRLMKVMRSGQQHAVKELTVEVRLQGEFDAAYVAGDNSGVLPTDTMKNTVYALAKDHSLDSIEQFGLDLSRHFQERLPAVQQVRIEINEKFWERIRVNGRPHEHAFTGGESARRICTIIRTAEQLQVTSGIQDWPLMKTTNSAFTGFPRDEYTTLPEAEDRVMATHLNATWEYGRTDVAFNDSWASVRRLLAETFAGHESQSVQHTLYAMGQAVLEQCADVQEIRLQMPNKHYLLCDLSPFDQENRNEIFIPVDEPYGMIEGRLCR